MILYPAITAAFGMTDHMAGIFLGGTIHDVAQVVGAGFSISDEAGETATQVKLIRVSMLAPVVIVVSLSYRGRGAAPGGAALPGFVIGFAVLAAINSLGWLPEWVKAVLQQLSSWALLVAIAAVGMRTRLDQVLQVGEKPRHRAAGGRDRVLGRLHPDRLPDHQDNPAAPELRPSSFGQSPRHSSRPGGARPRPHRAPAR